jgi:hypothetical protein
VQSIFGISRNTFPSIRERQAFLVHWGFSLSELYFMSLPQLKDHIQEINEYYKRKLEANESAIDTGGRQDNLHYGGNSVPIGSLGMGKG